MAWAPAYITVDEYKDYKHIEDDDDDIEIENAIEAASRAIDTTCNRQFGQVAAPEERAYTAWYDWSRCRWVVDIDDLQDADNLTVTVDGTAVTSYTLEAVNAVSKGLAWTRLVVGCDAEAQPTGAANEILPTASWGWESFPGAVVLAAKLQTQRLHKRRDAPFGIAGSLEQGSELRLLARVDPDVAVSLTRYVRPRRVG